MSLWKRLLGPLFMLSAVCAPAQTLTVAANMDVGEWVIQAANASVTMDPVSGATVGVNAIGTGAYPIVLGRLTITGGIPGRQFLVYTTQTGNLTFTGQNTGATFTQPYTNFHSSIFTTGVPGTYDSSGRGSFTDGGAFTGLPTSLQDDTYSTTFALLVADTTSSTTNASNTVQLTITIHIQTGIAITKTADLDFGDIITQGSTGQVTVTSAGGRTFTGGASQGPRGPTMASFNVIGKTGGNAASRRYQITFGGSGTPGQGSVTLSSGANTMSASLQAYINGAIPGSGRGTLDSTTGQQTFQVGGTLTVGAAQAEGDYTGIFTVTVTYN